MMNTIRKICAVTGSRAEYGMLYWLMKEIQQDPLLHLQLMVTGTHLSKEFGLTYQQIEQDGFVIDEKIEILLADDTPVGITKAIGIAVMGFAEALNRLKPDLLVVLGDRYEMLAAAQAGMVAKIPIAHLHGGEATEGAIDEAIRHSLTKMSHFHFVAAEPYRQRVIQLGENPERVFNFGALSLEGIRRLKWLTRAELEQAIGSTLGKINFLVTYHPVTLSPRESQVAIKVLLAALDQFPEAKVFFTKPNADPEYRVIEQWIDDYAASQPGRVATFTCLGQLKYLSLMKQIDVVIGNSSSGIIEAPAMKKPTVNIGDRQRGRLRSASIIDCQETTEAIISAIRKALSEDFKCLLQSVVSPYGNGDTAFRVKEYLKTVPLGEVLMKKFYELP